jgi:hypothetical protein
MALQDIPKKKTKIIPGFSVEIKPARKKKIATKPMIKSAAKQEIKAKAKVTVRVKPKAPATKTPMNKPKGLNDYLDKGQTPPSRNKKLPSDADVILKGYNDKKTIAKLKESKKKGKQ